MNTPCPQFLRQLAVGCAVLSVASGIFAAAAPKPNIVVVMVDDMGFSDLGCYGGEIPTPNIDALAASGLRFTQFYNAGRCCPSRASLMTGLFAHQAGVGHMVEDRGDPGYRGRLNDDCVTIAEVLHTAGYFTAMAGKWHLGQAQGVVPWKRGFDRSINSPTGGFYYGNSPRAELFLNGTKLDNNDPRLGANWYTTDVWTDFSIKFVNEAVAAQKPFFLYVAHNAPHFPLQAPAAEIAKFRGKYKAGWDRLREERHAREQKLGLLDGRWPLSPRPEEVKAWNDLTPSEQDRFDEVMAVYAACVAHMDTAVGRLVAALKQRGVFENTLILFLSDNGGNAEGGVDGRTEGSGPIGSPESNVRAGESWATLENTPFRRYKHFNHEGGIATPLIAHWPMGFAGRGELRSQVGHIIDVMPTCVQLAGASYPREFNGRAILPMEGRSLVPAFAGAELPREALYWEHEGNAAVRVGDWKLVRFKRTGKWELYNMAEDRTELHDLAASQPERAASLVNRWEAWGHRAHVLPYPDPMPGEGNPAGKKPGKAK